MTSVTGADNPAARYAELDRSLRRSSVALIIVVAATSTAFWSRGLVLVVAGWLPLTFYGLRLLVVRDEQALYRWGVTNTLLGGFCVGIASLTTGGVASPVLFFSVVIGLAGSLTFAHDARWALFPAVIVGGVAVIDALNGGWEQSDWLFLTSLVIVSLSVPRLVADSVQVEFSYRAKAVLDELTGCLNRTSLAFRLTEIEVQAQRTNDFVGVIVIDIDHFKSINDRFGHRAGDDVLRHVAYVIRKKLRRFELFYRTGGEEFMLLLPGATEGVAHRLAETIRTAVEDDDTRLTPVTVSLGVAAALAPASLEGLIDRADQALLDAKQDGRNRTVLATSAS